MTTTVKANGHYTMAYQLPCPCGASKSGMASPVYTPEFGWRCYCLECSRSQFGVPANYPGREHSQGCTMVPVQRGVGTGNYECPCGAYVRFSESR